MRLVSVVKQWFPFLDYLLRAYREGRLKYAQVLQKKLPIGSGAIESLIRQVVNLRMKGKSCRSPNLRAIVFGVV